MWTGLSTHGGKVLAQTVPAAIASIMIIVLIDGAARYRTAVLKAVPHTFYMLNPD